MEDKHVKVIEDLQKEIYNLERDIQLKEKSIIEKKTLIAAFLCGYGVGDTVTDGNVFFLVKSFSGNFWKGFRKKQNGDWSDNEEYIKGDFMKHEGLPIEFLHPNLKQ